MNYLDFEQQFLKELKDIYTVIIVDHALTPNKLPIATYALEFLIESPEKTLQYRLMLKHSALRTLQILSKANEYIHEFSQTKDFNPMVYDALCSIKELLYVRAVEYSITEDKETFMIRAGFHNPSKFTTEELSLS